MGRPKLTLKSDMPLTTKRKKRTTSDYQPSPKLLLVLSSRSNLACLLLSGCGAMLSLIKGKRNGVVDFDRLRMAVIPIQSCC